MQTFEYCTLAYSFVRVCMYVYIHTHTHMYMHTHIAWFAGHGIVEYKKKQSAQKAFEECRERPFVLSRTPHPVQVELIEMVSSMSARGAGPRHACKSLSCAAVSSSACKAIVVKNTCH